uniref:Uncharacterized protein n=1 Tax=Triticum urartu TaxID=4572 RepID=A0A8R7QHC6_TRIUA
PPPSPRSRSAPHLLAYLLLKSWCCGQGPISLADLDGGRGRARRLPRARRQRGRGLRRGRLHGHAPGAAFGRWMRWSPQMASTHDLVTQNFAKLPMGVVRVRHRHAVQRQSSVNSSYYNSLCRGVSRGSGRTVGVIREHRRADLWGSNMQTWMEDGRPSSICLSCPPAR